MGHRGGKEVYRELGRKLDGLTMRAPWNNTLYALLKELYSEEEAALVVRMPNGLADFDRVQRVTGYPSPRLQQLLDGLCSRTLVMDLWIDDRYYYIPSPVIIGLFEFTMMRTGPDIDLPELARLFSGYLEDDEDFSAANAPRGRRVGLMRTLPHEEAVALSDFTEILDYERALMLIEDADVLALGLCSCRHHKLHLGEKECDVPLETCSSMGMAADFMIRRDLARKVSREEMQETIMRSRDMGLVLNADNVKRNITFICHCCKCCCQALAGIRRAGYPTMVVTSNFQAHWEKEICTGCGTCVEVCPIDAIALERGENEGSSVVRINHDLCLGCGVCAIRCPAGALQLRQRPQRVLHPEDVFERVILQCLEKGTLQNQLFDDPQSISQRFMRGFLGGVLRLPPVKSALLGDTLRSTFLRSIKWGAGLQGRGWLAEL